MTVRELIVELLTNYALDQQVYIGKGMGPVRMANPHIDDLSNKMYVILRP